MLQDIDETTPVRDIFRQVWFNLFQFTADHPDYFHFSEQFSNSPIFERINQKEIDRMFTPIADIIRRGIALKIITNVEVDIILAFVFYPFIILANPRLCKNFHVTEALVEQSFQLAWDAIKF